MPVATYTHTHTRAHTYNIKNNADFSRYIQLKDKTQLCVMLLKWQDTLDYKFFFLHSTLAGPYQLNTHGKVIVLCNSAA